MYLKNKRILAVSIVVLILVLSLVVVFSESRASNVDGQLTRIACLGDSITNMTQYPADYQTLVGKTSIIENFGYNGATINFYSDRPYFFSDQYRSARNFLPNIVILMLGTNDARSNVNQQIDRIVGDYEHMISRIQIFGSSPKIFLVIPPPIYTNTLDLNATVLTQEVIPRIQQVANETGLPLIDVYTPLLNHPEYFPDGVHPNNEGAQVIANTIYDAITADSK